MRSKTASKFKLGTVDVRPAQGAIGSYAKPGAGEQSAALTPSPRAGRRFLPAPRMLSSEVLDRAFQPYAYPFT